jgi:phage baseplate assembly protein W
MTYRLTRKDKTYIDVSLAFEPNPITKDLTVLTDERAINNSLRNIMLISPLEVPFNRNFGSRIRDHLFDVVDFGTAGLLDAEIRRSVNFNEPRVKIVDLIVTPAFDQNAFDVFLKYKIIGSEKTFQVEQVLQPTK